MGLTCMGQAEGPKPQIGSGVGDAAQTVLYGVDRLMNRHIRKVKLKGNIPARQHDTFKTSLQQAFGFRQDESSSLHDNPSNWQGSHNLWWINGLISSKTAIFVFKTTWKAPKLASLQIPHAYHLHQREALIYGYPCLTKHLEHTGYHKRTHNQHCREQQGTRDEGWRSNRTTGHAVWQEGREVKRPVLPLPLLAPWKQVTKRNSWLLEEENKTHTLTRQK